MANVKGGTARIALLAAVLGASFAAAQTSHVAASDQDKKFLKELDQDSNFEIKTAQLALKKSKSVDVKQYATMLIHDHTQLKQKTRAADGVVHVSPVSSGSMSLGDQATYTKLELLHGDGFDKAYIQGLVKGNDDIVKDEASEAASSTVPSVKALATRGAALDTKHSEKAKQLAQAHGIQA